MSTNTRFFLTLWWSMIFGMTAVWFSSMWYSVVGGLLLGLFSDWIYNWVTAPERDQEADSRGDKSDD